MEESLNFPESPCVFYFDFHDLVRPERFSFPRIKACVSLQTALMADAF
jgi:hypothetical protein